MFAAEARKDEPVLCLWRHLESESEERADSLSELSSCSSSFSFEDLVIVGLKPVLEKRRGSR